MSGSIMSILPSTCTVVVPDPGTKLHDVIDRWSDALISLPYAVITPSNTDDIRATVEYAAQKKLKVIPTGGGHAAHVPISDKTICLDMKRFNHITIDEEKAEVTFGGGCLAGLLHKTLAAKGYYTSVPNSNEVGMVGALLGGLNHPLGGVHGMGIDMVRSITIIPFSSTDGEQLQQITLSKESQDEKLKLFNVLRGAGSGLGVITKITLSIYRLADLELEKGNQIWTRNLVFSSKALSTAIDTYLSLQAKIVPRLSLVLGFMRAPPAAPQPGAPMILLAMSYFGPASDAERDCAISFSSDVISKATSATTTMVPFSNMNDGLAPASLHGGYKELHGAFLQSISSSSLHSAFASYLSFTSVNSPTRFRSSIIFPTANIHAVSSLAPNSAIESFFRPRDRGVFTQVKPFYTDAEEKPAADKFGVEVLNTVREEDRRRGARDWGFANNIVEGQSAGTVYDDVQIEEIKRVKAIWDREEVGWSPIVDGWEN